MVTLALANSVLKGGGRLPTAGDFFAVLLVAWRLWWRCLPLYADAVAAASVVVVFDFLVTRPVSMVALRCRSLVCNGDALWLKTMMILMKLLTMAMALSIVLVALIPTGGVFCSLSVAWRLWRRRYYCRCCWLLRLLVSSVSLPSSLSADVGDCFGMVIMMISPVNWWSISLPRTDNRSPQLELGELLIWYHTTTRIYPYLKFVNYVGKWRITVTTK